MATLNLRPAELAVGGNRIHYAWMIVVITAQMRLVSSSFRMSFPALVPFIAAGFGWEVWLITLAFSLQWVISGVFGPPAGWLGDRYGARFTMTVGAMLYIVGMILTGFMTEIWHLFLFFGIILSASMGIFQVPLTVAVTSWFRRHLGIGMGLLQSSQGFGPVVALPIMLGLITWFSVGNGADLTEWLPFGGSPDILGIRMAFWIPGIIGGIILLRLTRIFYNSPEDVGLRQLGDDGSTPARRAPAIGQVFLMVFWVSCILGIKLLLLTLITMAFWVLGIIGGIIGSTILLSLIIIGFYKSPKVFLRAFRMLGTIGGIILLPLILIIFYKKPKDVELRQLGDDGATPVRRAPTSGPSAKERTRVFLRQVRKTPAFWNLIGIHYWGCAGHSIIIVFLPQTIVAALEPQWNDLPAGDPALLVAGAIAGGAAATMSIVSTVTRFGVPIAADLLGSKWVMATCFFLQVVPVLVLLVAVEFYPAVWMFYLFAVLFGIGFGGEMSAFPIINRQYYGNAPIGTTYGFQMMGAGAGMACGAGLGALLLALTGGYTATVALSFIMSLIGVVAIMFLPTTHRHQLPDWEQRLPAELRPRPPAAAAAAPPSPAPATSGGNGDGD